MNKDLEQKWDKAFANPGEAVPVGDLVVCDVCDADFTSKPDKGGMIFESKAVCPVCMEKMLPTIRQYAEERFIRARNIEWSFADFVRRYRGPNAVIRVRK